MSGCITRTADTTLAQEAALTTAMKALNALALGCLLASAQTAAAGVITFAGSEYDNTANTVTAGPVTHNNQTTGVFRDIFWWRINNGAPLVGSADFINQGNSLKLCGNSACVGPGPIKALNFTGPSISGGQSYLTVYDTTPADGTATRNLFQANGLHLGTDILFVKHNVSAGLVVMYSEGQDGLALLAHNGAGNNSDHAQLDLVWMSNGGGQQLLSTANLPATSFVATGDGSPPNGLDHWYHIDMDLAVTGNTWNLTGNFFKHTIEADPTSALGSLITSISASGSLSNPDGSACSATPPNNNTCLSLVNPGEIGLIVEGNESISLPDNVGVSFYDLTIDVPEPSTLAAFGLGLAGLGFAARRRLQRPAKVCNGRDDGKGAAAAHP